MRDFTMYVIQSEIAAKRSDTIAWDRRNLNGFVGHWLSADVMPGENVVATVIMRSYGGGVWQAERQYGECGGLRSRLSVGSGIDVDTDYVVSWLMGDTTQPIPVVITGPGELHTKILRSRIGGGYRSFAKAEAELTAATPEILAIAAKHNTTVCPVEVRYTSPVMGGRGNNSALVELDAGGLAVIEWGGSEDGDWETMTPLAEHNRSVSEMNGTI